MMSQSSMGVVSHTFENIDLKHLPQLNLRFSFRLVYILRATKIAASAGVP
jgi:hypothetical protein